MDLETASDSRLLGELAHGRGRALAEVFRRHGGAVHSLARQVVSSTAVAYEITQNVFLDLWTQLKEFDSERGALRAFLATEVHGRAVDVKHFENRVQISEGVLVGDPVLVGSP